MAPTPPSGSSERLSSWFAARYFSLDPRWLGVFRVLFGVLLFVDGARRWADVRMFYSNDGIFPNHFSLFAPMGRDVFSLFHMFSTVGEASVGFALALFCYACFTVGYRTKLFHFLSLVCVTSLNARNIFVENGGTVVVNILTLWTLFLPLGRRFSVDALRASWRAKQEKTAAELNLREPRPTEPFVSLVVLALLLQWSVIYFFNCVHKGGTGWHNGSAIHYFWHQDRIVTWLAVWSRTHVPYGLSQVMTWGTLAVEGVLGVILLIPFFQPWLRRIALLLALGLHGGIAASSRLGPFSYVMTCFFVLLLGQQDWDWVTRWFGAPARARTVIYDADCGVCLWTARLLKRLDPFERLRFQENTDLESLPPGVTPEMVERSVVVVAPDGAVSVEAEAVYQVLVALPFGAALGVWLKLPGLSALASRAYRAFAERRHSISAWFGLGVCGAAPARSEAAGGGTADTEQETSSEEASVGAAPVSATPSRGVLAFLREATVAVLVVVLSLQVCGDNAWMRRRVKVRMSPWMQTIVHYPRIFQGWGMFAPEPPYDDGRVIVDGRTRDGRKLDPFTGVEPDFDPYTPTGWGQEQFLCDYNNRIRFSGHRGNRRHLEDYLANHHRWYGEPEDELVAFDVWWVQDRSPPPGQTRGTPLPPEKLLSHGVVTDSGATPWLTPGAPPAPTGGAR